MLPSRAPPSAHAFLPSSGTSIRILPQNACHCCPKERERTKIWRKKRKKGMSRETHTLSPPFPSKKRNSPSPKCNKTRRKETMTANSRGTAEEKKTHTRRIFVFSPDRVNFFFLSRMGDVNTGQVSLPQLWLSEFVRTGAAKEATCVFAFVDPSSFLSHS